MPLTITVKTKTREEMVDITTALERLLAGQPVREGLCVVYVPHTTAGITVNEGADPAVCEDILRKLGQLAPANAGYRHLEGNADSHIKASLMGSSVTLLLEEGHMVLGTWQRVFFCEFDGPRTRRVLVRAVPS